MKGTSGTRGSLNGEQRSLRRRAKEREGSLAKNRTSDYPTRLSKNIPVKIFENFPAPAAISTLKEGRYINVNDSCLSLFGYRRKEMIGRTALDLAIWENPAAWAPLVRKLREQGYLCKEPITIRTKSGVIRHALWSAEILDVSGEDVMLNLFYDITDRERMEQELSNSLKKYQEIFENIQDVYYETDIDGTILELSPSLERLSKWKRKELIGKSLYEIYANPKERAILIETIQKTGVVSDYEIILKDKDGKFFNCSVNARLLYDEGGVPRKIIGSMRDNTGRKKMEEQLRESEEKYRRVVDNIGIGVSLISPKMEILTLNAQMKEWYPQIDPSRKPICYKAFNNPPRKRVCSYCPTYKTLQDGEIHESVTETPLGGAIRNFRIISTPIKDQNGNVMAAIEMVEDITEKKEMQERLKESEKWYRTIFETTASATMVIEEDTTVSFVNKAFEEGIGYSKEEVEGKKSWTDFVAEKDLAIMKEYHRLRREEPAATPRSYETQFLDRKGNIRDILATVSIIPGTKKSVASLMDITNLKRVERSLKAREEELSVKAINLEELNTALKILLKQREEDQQDLEGKVLANVRKLVLPYVEKLNLTPLAPLQAAYVEVIASNLHDIISPFLRNITASYMDLTPREIEVIDLVREGKSAKDIALMLNSSIRTIEFHKEKIRRKLGLTNTKKNLRTHLLSLTKASSR